MTVANLAVCFGPTLLRDKEEMVAALMNTQSSIIVVEILLENWRQMFNFGHWVQFFGPKVLKMKNINFVLSMYTSLMSVV